MQYFYGLSLWFFIGIALFIIANVLIFLGTKEQGGYKNKKTENGYLLLLLSLISIFAEFIDFSTLLFSIVVLLILLFALYYLYTIGSKKILRSNLKSQYKRNQKISSDEIDSSKYIDNNHNNSHKHKIINAYIPHYVYYAKEFFWIIFIVWIIRGCLFEVYQIPTSSMRPNLIVGDFIVVSKYSLGIRSPFDNSVVIKTNVAKRGDVVVFNDPKVENRKLIKRLIAVGGDTIEYNNKKLTINGIEAQYIDNNILYQYNEMDDQKAVKQISAKELIEKWSGRQNRILVIDHFPSFFFDYVEEDQLNFNNNYCVHDQSGEYFTCRIPDGYYFFMGDNRDNSADSRYWGVVDEKALIGKAEYVLANFAGETKDKRIFLAIQ